MSALMPYLYIVLGYSKWFIWLVIMGYELTIGEMYLKFTYFYLPRKSFLIILAHWS